MQDPKNDSFVEAMRQSYGNSPIESKFTDKYWWFYCLLGIKILLNILALLSLDMILSNTYFCVAYPAIELPLMIAGSHKYRAHQVLERNSIPQENMSSSDKISKDVKNGKTNRVSPNTGTSLHLSIYSLHVNFSWINCHAQRSSSSSLGQ